MEKKKVLWLSDFACSTGFAMVAQNMINELQKTGLYEFTVIGINHHGEPYDHLKWPFDIYPAMWAAKFSDPRYADVFGRQRLLDMLGTGKYDILFTLQDTFIVESIGKEIVSTRKQLIANGHKAFKWIYYYPVDGKLKENWITNSAALADYPVTYTDYAKRETEEVADINPTVIYHGVNIKDFYPISQEEKNEFRSTYFVGQADDKFIVTNVNRNQRRKDLPRTIEAFAKFHKLRPNSMLYLHTKPNDVGGSIPEMCRYFGLAPIKDYNLPTNFNENTGLPISIVNKIYNVSDVIVSTTLGEGWGLSSTEAMATKTPILFPDHTSLTEIAADGRARLIKTKGMVCLGAEDNNQFRPLTDVDDLVNALVDMYDNREKYTKMADKAYKWVQELSWNKITKQWLEVFEKASNEQQSPGDIGRNERCPICLEHGVAIKFKRCFKHNPLLLKRPI